MTYKTRQSYLGSWLSIALCFAGANCGDPVAGTWVNMSAPSASANQYAMYMSTLTFGDALSVTVDLETVRTKGALTYAGCTESLMGTGTYMEAAGAITSTFDTGTDSRTGCVFMADNLTSMPVDDTAKATLVSLAGGKFTIAANVLTLVTGNSTLKYMKM